ncbi:MAG: membrane protein of unknown function [Promethearchaeota archaeon]|nr:MAG: membrane protein of unknown function [Candidatus Lokiarchaeota archaeon]
MASITSIYKSYLISLAAYFGINITVGLIYTVLTNGFGEISGISVLALLVLSIFYLPSYLLTGLMGSGGNVAIILLAIGAIVASVIAAILSGYFGESKGLAFGGWALTILTAFILAIIVALVDSNVFNQYFESTSTIFSTITNSISQDGGFNAIEIDLILGAQSIGIEQIVRNQAIIEYLGGVNSIEKIYLSYNVLLSWDLTTILRNAFIIKQLSDAGTSALSQAILLNAWNPTEFSVTNAFLAVTIFENQYIPPSPAGSSIIFYVSITSGINLVLYGMFALGAQRAAFY